MKEKSWLKRVYERGRYALSSFFAWGKRAFTGKKDLLETPSGEIRKAFFSKKAAVIALAFLSGLFLFVFLAPSFIPMNVNYTDPLQQNVAPGYSLLRAPKKLKKSVGEIDGFADFTVGRTTEGAVFVWGNTKDVLRGTDMKKLPDDVKKSGAAFVAAGKDHALAITKDGKLIGWGDNSCGQYGTETKLGAITMPESLQSVNQDEVESLVCGYQTSAIVFKDSRAYAWGNTNAVPNLAEFSALNGVKKLVFTNSAAVAILLDGTFYEGTLSRFSYAVGSKTGDIFSLSAYLSDKRVTEIAATNKCVALLTDEGELIVSGVFENGEELLPILKEGEYFSKLSGGTRHFVGVTNLGNVYAWGHNAYGQCDVRVSGAENVFTGALQTYVVDGNGKLIKSAGLKGYLMGTDGRGRDVFTRIAHGGKMTMTIGAVAVLLSSAIAVAVGCISGYFGGMVDLVLMRVTEIFSSIPFLPFAMLLSQIVKYYNVSETMRIFMIMLILGALSWTGLARVIRGQVLAEREKEFVTAARALGVKERVIAFKHVLPNIVSVILVSMTLDFAGCLLTESSLSYLGFGVQQPQPTWGNMLNGANNSTVIQNYWWQWLFPALFLSLATICINVVGDCLRDALDPKTNQGR